MSESGDHILSGDQQQRISVSKHEKNLRQIRCVVSHRSPVTLHHCHSGSMCDLGPEFPNPGWAQRQNPFLQIPLVALYHVGNAGIDGSIGVVTWERTFGSQLDFLHEINGKLPYDIWNEARQWTSKNLRSLRLKKKHPRSG